MLRRRTRVFLGVSAFLAVVDISFVALNQQASLRALEDALERRGQAAMRTFRVGMALSEDNMLQMATFVSHDPHVRTLFRQGAEAVEAEGGGAGGPRAQHYRRALYDQVYRSWSELTDLFGFRQLHFHLPPGSTSFLRVHRPDKFGDSMHDLRHTVVTVNAEQEPVTGFETGRVYSGLRGVTPVYAPIDDGDQTFVGALEAGISFQRLLDRLQPRISGEAAVLLGEGHVRSSMWPEAIRRHFGADQPQHGYYLEAATRDGFLELTGRLQPELAAAGKRTRLLRNTAQGAVAVTHAPLYDFLGQQGGELPPVGRLVIAQDASEAVTEFNLTQRRNIAFAIATFILFEILLYIGIRRLSRRLEDEVDERTREVHDLNQRLRDQATRDTLTGLANRRHFMERLAEEIARARRAGHALSLAIADVDHFKQINDEYGHVAGDAALRTLAAVLERHQRVSDLPARYGGEEFTILMPETDLTGAETAMEDLRQRVEGTAVDRPEEGPIHQTISVGVAALQSGDTADTLIQRADAALYRAKRTGRNRVISEG
ncbi:diguanylate cyclase (GGDEF) domain-containing protein [Thiohalospira halophila DSM 15071]|uniref:diguanylate cyclase n=1 Tax=Thiohalospira halophila DSM 15071 TaxID=1123397 RepID=A0A1I1VNL7_9GAMM|nr:diguanylate cyclase [Thiohalospira halophila]SFD84531.1 diguanylate cyclase (GGDEF) domain-containing protein [Thiohalospira halophila DSM 15071]